MRRRRETTRDYVDLNLSFMAVACQLVEPERDEALRSTHFQIKLDLVSNKICTGLFSSLRD